MSDQLSWGHPLLEFTFEWSPERAVSVAAIRVGDRIRSLYRMPAVEILTTDKGHSPASHRLAHTQIGVDLRYVSHEEHSTGTGRILTIHQQSDGIVADLTLEVREGIAAVHAQVIVRNRRSRSLVLRATPSLTLGFTDGDAGPLDPLAGWDLVSGTSDWLGEGRWTRRPLRGPETPMLAEHLTGHNPRGAIVVTSNGTWSTGHRLPVAAVENTAIGVCLAWQIEHNGAWRWEVGTDTTGGYLSLSGPTDIDAAWTHVVDPDDTFTSVPVTVVVANDFTGALDALTDYRRVARRPHSDNTAMPVIFNDYMNTLNGDPTTDRLIPLIADAGAAGAEVFCIDAGWYDDSGFWWDTVGEWMPSTTRFPGGLGEVINAIRAAGMVPGLWLEPEVIGVRSAAAEQLPVEAFLSRNGQRIVEHDRYHLDLRHPAAIAHLDAVVDRLVDEFGVGFFKFDYNINPGSGTDYHADSPGDGLLQHNRAHLDWLDSVLDRHPSLVIENCASGAMRMDFAMLSRLAMQSTSDQQDFAKYPPIAASAPLSMLPEQAASWAYPQPEMSDEEITFTLVTGLLGRFYVSGYLNRMTADQKARVRQAIAVAKSLRTEIASGHAHWPLGLPEWNSEWTALALRGADDLVSLWRRGDNDRVTLSFPHLVGRDIDITPVFPTDLPAWHASWHAATGTLDVRAADAPFAARTLRLSARPTGAV